MGIEVSALAEPLGAVVTGWRPNQELSAAEGDAVSRCQHDDPPSQPARWRDEFMDRFRNGTDCHSSHHGSPRRRGWNYGREKRLPS